jgi:hypothetical protein
MESTNPAAETADRATVETAECSTAESRRPQAAAKSTSTVSTAIVFSYHCSCSFNVSTAASSALGYS